MNTGLATALLLGLTVSIAHARPTVYDVQRTLSGGYGTVNGTITTDGALGYLAETDITNWNLAVTVNGHLQTLQGPGGSNNSYFVYDPSCGYDGHGISATSSEFDFNFLSTGTARFSFHANRGP